MRLTPPIGVVPSHRRRVVGAGVAAAVLNATWFSVSRTGACFGGVQAAVGRPDSVSEFARGVGVKCGMAVLL